MMFFIKKILFLAVLLSIIFSGFAQYCTSPSTIYGLTNTGLVYPINITNGNVSSAINVRGSSTPSSSNGLAYNPFYNRFFYFKRNPDASGQQFVSFDFVNNTPVILASCPTTTRIVTGCCNLTGDGYYCIDILGRLYYYNIALNSWTVITNTFRTSEGINVSALFSTLGSGDIAMDVFGNLWIISSSATNYCLYKTKSLLPVVPVNNIEVIEVAPLRPTPTGFVFAGICFNEFGQIYLSTAPPDDKLFILNNNLTLTYLNTFTISGVGNDLTSCYFPASVLIFNQIIHNQTYQDKKSNITITNPKHLIYNINIEKPYNYRYIYIYDINGSLLKKIKDIKKTNPINMIEYQPGIYIINVDGLKSFKILK